MRVRLLYLVASASLILGVGGGLPRGLSLMSGSDWCRSETQEREWIQIRTLRYGIDYAEMRGVLSRLPEKAGVWVEYSDSVGAFPMSEYYAEMLQFYGAPRYFYTHPQENRTAYHLILRNSRVVELKPWP